MAKIDPKTLLPNAVQVGPVTPVAAVEDVADGAVESTAEPTVTRAPESVTGSPIADEIGTRKSELVKDGKGFIFNPNRRTMRDPITNDKFPAGYTVRIKELGNWTLAQVNAGILREGKADDVGVSPEENSQAESSDDNE